MFITSTQDKVFKAVGTANAGQLLHGIGGMFNTPGLENPFLSTVIQPTGIAQYLPAYPSNYQNPLYGYITEIVDDGDAEPVEICDDGPTATLKNGELTAAFGRVQTATKSIELATASMVLNSADRTDLMFAGQLLSPDGVERPANVDQGNLIDNMVKSEMVKASWLMGMKMNRMVWQGDPADATAGEGYKPFNGFSKLVKTGYVDATTNNAVAALDSVVIDGAWGTVGPGGTFAIVQQLRYLMSFLEQKANATVGGATFAICMRSEMWEAVSDAWAAVYADEMSAAIAADTASRWMLDGASLTANRDAMKRDQILPIGGKLYPVIIDSGIKQLSNADDGANIPLGSYSSSIFVIPLTLGVGLPATYWEYLDWGIAQTFLAQAGITDQVFWTDGSRFLWTLEKIKTCIKLQCRTEPRLVLRTPQLAARIDDLLVTPVRLMPTAHADDAGYVGGGETTRTAPVVYGP